MSRSPGWGAFRPVIVDPLDGKPAGCTSSGCGRVFGGLLVPPWGEMTITILPVSEGQIGTSQEAPNEIEGRFPGKD